MPVGLPTERLRVAQILVAMGPERASTMLRQLPESKVRALVADMATIDLSPEEAREVRSYARCDDVGQLALRADGIARMQLIPAPDRVGDDGGGHAEAGVVEIRNTRIGAELSANRCPRVVVRGPWNL